MRAKTRLYLTADRAALVREGDPRAASLYAAIGDEIPDSAAARFGLVDGMIDAADPVAILPEPILRATALGDAPVHVAYDLLAGRDHDRVGLPPEPGHYAQAKEAAPGDDKLVPATPDKEAAPAKTKEAKPARGPRAGKADAAKG